MTYLWFKTLHVVAVVAWMAGLFYVGRVIVNHVEALARPEPARGILHEQLAGMERRAYRGILTPAAVLGVAFAAGMLAAQPALLGAGWLHAKLGLVALLAGFHLYCGRLIARLAAGVAPVSSLGARALNEIPTVILLGITLLAVFKSRASAGALAQAVLGLALLIGVGIAQYARRRMRRGARPTEPLIGATLDRTATS
jgi:putative membrane protein